jgi:adenosylcobinamide-GDP ribazoletransferase
MRFLVGDSLGGGRTTSRLRDEETSQVSGQGGAEAPRGWPRGAPLFALQFLTIMPPLIRRAPTVRELGASEAFFPLTGAAVGLSLVLLDTLLALAFSPFVRNVLLVVALAALTGAIHLDGLSDTCDGLFGGRDAASRLAIMRDPRAGVFGVVGIVSVLLLQVAALAALTDQLRPLALICAPCFGRWAIVQATWSFPYVREQGMGRAFKDGVRRSHLLAAGGSALAIGWLCLGPSGVVLFAAATVFVWLAGVVVARRLGGLTGDTYGALCQVVEVSSLLAAGTSLAVGRG